MAIDITAPMRGLDGLVMEGSTAVEVAYIDNWSLAFSRDEIEVTKLGATSKEFLSALSSATLSCSGTLIANDTKQNALMQEFMTINAGAMTSTTFAFTLYAYKGAVGDDTDSAYFEVDAVATSVSVDVTSGGVATFNFEGRVSGDVNFEHPVT